MPLDIRAMKCGEGDKDACRAQQQWYQNISDAESWCPAKLSIKARHECVKACGVLLEDSGHATACDCVTAKLPYLSTIKDPPPNPWYYQLEPAQLIAPALALVFIGYLLWAAVRIWRRA